MLTNKKLLWVLTNLVAVVVVVAFLLNVVMFIWTFVAPNPPIALFEGVPGGVVAYYVLLNKLVTLMFIYVLNGALAGMIKSSKLQEGFRK